MYELLITDELLERMINNIFYLNIIYPITEKAIEIYNLMILGFLKNQRDIVSKSDFLLFLFACFKENV